MSVSKRTVIVITLLFIIIISVFTAILDFSRLSGYYDLYNSYPSEFIKRINVLLAALLVCFAGKDGLNKQDSLYMKSAFIFICCGEISFLLGKPALAISFFIVCQCLLITRHCTGFMRKIKETSTIKKSLLALIFLVLISLFLFTIITLYPMIIMNNLAIIAGLYGIILSISLWAGLTSYILGLFPYKNSSMIAMGMLCFYFCDISVGLDGLLGSGTTWVFVTSLTWIFYTPAITLLALSCYSYKTTSIQPINLHSR